ncbi:hypothetical protein CBM2615_B70012 [Cupriavidus taiwanensis]|uniref:Uncharacterized protein n=1 Tax=Cupriavidus taiwanensis TaxID=164546 RepID=A0A976B2Y9_9BURK|nr:hypothetical protein CBM2614_B60012 [Cupriavidus taiwanensis]SOZ70133.1 hypothetical protein CBM2615_B70012 [Cupriavidus taiwanensis]SOZ73000.1 hypothetical protein CBM2613_B50142 [Cupriavidus taiwanensis]SPA09902.1 hypothetical protein CBM2625_B60058 [Cupriavidus taiwanensis]
MAARRQGRSRQTGGSEGSVSEAPCPAGPASLLSPRIAQSPGKPRAEPVGNVLGLPQTLLSYRQFR